MLQESMGNKWYCLGKDIICCALTGKF